MHLDLSRCTKLKKLPDNLPENLMHLDLSRCTELKKLPDNLPENLNYLDLSGCTGLIELPENLPDNLQTLNLSGCNNLPNTPELIKVLTDLEIKNSQNPYFSLIWPEHIEPYPEIGNLKTKISEAYKKFYKEFYEESEMTSEPNATDSAKFPLLTLVHRFMNESVAGRGGIPELMTTMMPIADAVEDKPWLLPILGDIANHHLAACINQPVAGMTACAIWCDIASAQTIGDKIKKARPLFALEIIIQQVSQLQNSDGGNIGSGVEVELGNALLREVHKKLLDEEKISKPWPGIPNQIAYEGHVKSFLTEENIEAVTQAIIEGAVEKPYEQIAQLLCAGPHQTSWADIVIGDEARTRLASELKAINVNYENSSVDEETYHTLVQQIDKDKLELSTEKTMAALEPSDRASPAAQHRVNSAMNVPGTGQGYQPNY